MASWGEFEAAAHEMASRGRQLFYRGGDGEGLLTTVAGDGLPRTHPVNIGIVGDRLLVFVQRRSAKAKDLTADGRYALHAYLDPAAPHEFLLRGRAREITDTDVRADAGGVWPFRPKDYPLFELDIEHALFGERASADDWPPRYTSWRPGSLRTAPRT